MCEPWAQAWHSVGPLNIVEDMARWRSIGGQAAARLRDVAHLLTTPLLPDDLLGTVNPVWSTSEPAGRVVAVRRETTDTSTLVIRTGPRRPRHRAGQFVGVGTRLDGSFHGQHFAMADVDADTPFDRDTIRMFTHPDGMGILFPLPGSRARIMFFVDAPSRLPTEATGVRADLVPGSLEAAAVAVRYVSGMTAPPTEPLVTVIVVTYNSGADIHACLSSLQRMTPAKSYEVVVWLCEWVLNTEFFCEVGNLLVVAWSTDVESDNDQSLVFILLLHTDQMRNAVATRNAPRRVEVEDEHLSVVLRKQIALTVREFPAHVVDGRRLHRRHWMRRVGWGSRNDGCLSRFLDVGPVTRRKD